MRIDHGLLPGHVLQRQPRGARAVVVGTCTDTTSSGPVLATVRKGDRVVNRLKDRLVGKATDGRAEQYAEDRQSGRRTRAASAGA